jgi:serine/threonine protein kinase/tetratricopeptide (TPR) repeat protein
MWRLPMSAERNLSEQEGPVCHPDQPIPTDAYRPPVEGPGTKIGPYKLLQQIGEGGFGIVYMAEQDKPVHRRVALKIIKPGMDSAQVIARFEAERQALAMMDHQNIAKVYDAGTTDYGRPFFAMELVHGVPITRYCDDNHLTVRERLELFVPICKAIQHAHQKGIIHRDLKPSNVLVCLYDGQPVPKVIDFGVAKATEQRLTERTMFTQYGQIVGTFEYMSPEQAEMSQLGVDTRSDIYSLGVMLYELLTGSTPLQRQRLREAGLAEMLKIVKEEEPPKPSTRLSSTQEAPKIAAARRTEPVKLAKLLRGELDWVVMRCLEKDRARRYDTANGLARDIERYLHDEPVEAGPPGTGYRLRKLARKHRTALSIAGLFAMFLVLAAAVSIWQAVRATRAEGLALAERDRAEQEKDRAEAGFKMARDTVDRFFTQVGESQQLKAQGMEKFRRDLLQNAKDFYERLIREQRDAPEARQDLGLAHLRLAGIQQALGDFTAAQTSSDKAIEILGELARAHPDVAEYQRDLAASIFRLGAIHFDAGRSDKAELAYQQASPLQEKLASDYPGVAEYQRSLATTHVALGIIYYRAGKFEKAQDSLEQAQALWVRLGGNKAKSPEDRHGLATAQKWLGDTYTQRGSYEKAEAKLKENESICQRLVHEDPDNPTYLHSLGKAYTALGNLYYLMSLPQKAEASVKQALQIFEKLAHDHPDVLEYPFEVGRSYDLLADTIFLGGRPEAALSWRDKAIQTLERVVGKGYGAGRAHLLNTRINRAIILAAGGDHTQATDEAKPLALQEGLNVNHIYNLACVFSQSSAAAEKDTKLSPTDRARLAREYADQAMGFLHLTLAKGYQHAAWLKKDKDLAPLHSHEDWPKLVQEVEQRANK